MEMEAALTSEALEWWMGLADSRREQSGAGRLGHVALKFCARASDRRKEDLTGGARVVVTQGWRGRGVA